MKIFNKILIGMGIAAGMLLTSCSLTTISESTFDESSVFADPSLTELQIYSIYEVYGEQNSHRGRYQPYYGFNTDVEMVTSNTITDDKVRIPRYDCLPTNTQLNVSSSSGGNPYEDLFTGVERANLAIKGIREYGDINNNAKMAALLGEALVARAMLYLELTKAYGEVPARFEPVSSETLYLNKSDRDTIYVQILNDLEESFNYLTYSTTTRSDRAGLAFAKGLYARIGLIASGYAQRPDEGAVGTGNAGSVRLSNNPELQKSVLYPKILEALKDVIANSGLSLMDYETLWKQLNNKENLTYGPEVMFVIPYNDGRGRWNYSFAIRDETTFSNNSRGGQAVAVPYLYYWYGENDVRRDLSVVNYVWDSTLGGDYPYPAGIQNWYFGKFRFEWMFSQPYDGGNDDGVKPIYMRYSDILLMAAEVANSSDCGARDENYAKDCLRTVMERAYANDPSEGDAEVDALSGESQIFEYIQKQRALEFVGEFLRKEDLIRWNCLKEKMDAAAEELDDLRNGRVGTITGTDYSKLFPEGADRQYVWYRRYTDADGLPNIYIYGIHLGETESDATTTPPGSYDWQPFLNSEGATSSYISSTSFDQSGSGYSYSRAQSGAGGGFYDNDPNTKQFWPIPAVDITNAQGYLVNDYGYVQ